MAFVRRPFGLMSLFIGVSPLGVHCQISLSFSLGWKPGDYGETEVVVPQVRDDATFDGVTFVRGQDRTAVTDDLSATVDMRRVMYMGRLADRGCGGYHLRSRFVPVDVMDQSAPLSAWESASPPISNIPTQQASNNMSDADEPVGPALFAAFTLSFAASLVIMFICCRDSDSDSDAEAREISFGDLAEPFSTATQPAPRTPLVESSCRETAEIMAAKAAVDVPPQVGETVSAAELAFQFKPSVGTWLCQPVPAKK
eukprot:TRINITY_DN61677_c0_g1_i1.p1 TRINITY_DN61677_c0_g1~~TRINITY_DN61677_c0_g1_i1.p1  ORF type:complete len:289 (+),score=48.64 TRINITY_DN61677_c0_g1_i1:104-868(+)